MFEVNKNMEVTVKQVGNRTALVIDDFYKNPDEVRELALTSEYENQNNQVNGFPGTRCFVDTPEVKEKLYNTYFHLCDTY